jgi:asparagine synthase (glutamine-hydrolysing)
MKTRLPECYILQYDRLTTAFNLNWEAPYLSREIIEYLAGITEPDALRSDDTATYLKALLRSHLPNSVLDRPKEQRPHFLESWADSGPVKEAFQLLLNGTCVDIGLVSKRWLTHQLDTASSRRHAFRYLWAVLVLEIWYRLFISSPITYEAPEISLTELLSE